MSANVIKVNGDYKVKAAQGGTISLDAGSTGNVAITGSLTVTGDTILNYTTSFVTQNTEIQDNIIVLNRGEQSNQIRLGEAGIKIDRGTNAYGDAYLTFIEGIDWIDSAGVMKTGLFSFRTEQAGLCAIQTVTINTDGNDLVINTGSAGATMSVRGTVDYENNVTDDDDIPNKKYVDNKIALGGGGKVNITQPETIATLTIANQKTFRVNNSLTFNGTDNSTVNFASGGTVAYTSSSLSQFGAATAADFKDKISGTTGSGNLVFATNPTFPSGFKIGVAPNEVAISGTTGSGSMVLSSSPTITGSPIIAGVTISGATGTSNLVFSNSPTIINPTIQINNAQNVATASQVLTGITGTAGLVLSNSPTLVTPILGVASATSINKVTITAPLTSSTLTIANAKTLTVNTSLTFNGNDSTINFRDGGNVVYSTDLSSYVLTSGLQTAIITTQIPDANIVNNTTAKNIGYLGRPINPKVIGYAIQFGDQGKTIYTSADVLIPDNGILALPVGTVIHIIATENISIYTSAGSSDILRWGQQTADLIGLRNLAKYGMATIIKVETNVQVNPPVSTWYISGGVLT
jgi:hypothetical protein